MSKMLANKEEAYEELEKKIKECHDNGLEYPEGYIEISSKWGLLRNTNINILTNDDIHYGDLCVLVLNAMRTKIYNNYLWDYKVCDELKHYTKSQGILINKYEGEEKYLSFKINNSEKKIFIPTGFQTTFLEQGKTHILWYAEDNLIDLLSE